MTPASLLQLESLHCLGTWRPQAAQPIPYRVIGYLTHVRHGTEDRSAVRKYVFVFEPRCCVSAMPLIVTSEPNRARRTPFHRPAPQSLLGSAQTFWGQPVSPSPLSLPSLIYCTSKTQAHHGPQVPTGLALPTLPSQFTHLSLVPTSPRAHGPLSC